MTGPTMDLICIQLSLAFLEKMLIGFTISKILLRYEPRKAIYTNSFFSIFFSLPSELVFFAESTLYFTHLGIRIFFLSIFC